MLKERVFFNLKSGEIVMRLILALRLPHLNLDDERFQKLRVRMIRDRIEGTWTGSDQLHIPLFGVGDVGQDTFHAMYETLRDVIRRQSAFALRISGVWGFPVQDHASLLWAGVQNSISLRSFQEAAGNALRIPGHEWLRPHIPLVYLKRHQDVTDLVSPFKNFDFGKVAVTEVAFLEKIRGIEAYRTVGSFPLIHPGRQAEAHF